MRVRVNPDRLAAAPGYRVDHPRSGRPFPSPEPFDLTETDRRDPRVVRLLPPADLPGGVAGGVFGDLVPAPRVEPPAPAKKSAKQGE